LYRADEIGISIGTGLTRVRHRSDDYVDKKSKPTDEMPTWWISSNWVPSESESEDEEDDKDEDDRGEGDRGEEDRDDEVLNDIIHDLDGGNNDNLNEE
jgi:hypothetical protein